ncbi:MAG: hypothetical protein EPN20_16845 [Magnetospirillum sp.]|nr:MAG: hypothetical protein EPN20_16845 [Magnetospirillum sp.]
MMRLRQPVEIMSRDQFQELSKNCAMMSRGLVSRSVSMTCRDFIVPSGGGPSRLFFDSCGTAVGATRISFSASSPAKLNAPSATNRAKRPTEGNHHVAQPYHQHPSPSRIGSLPRPVFLDQSTKLKISMNLLPDEIELLKKLNTPFGAEWIPNIGGARDRLKKAGLIEHVGIRQRGSRRRQGRPIHSLEAIDNTIALWLYIRHEMDDPISRRVRA